MLSPPRDSSVGRAEDCSGHVQAILRSVVRIRLAGTFVFGKVFTLKAWISLQTMPTDINGYLKHSISSKDYQNSLSGFDGFVILSPHKTTPVQVTSK